MRALVALALCARVAHAAPSLAEIEAEDYERAEGPAAGGRVVGRPAELPDEPSYWTPLVTPSLLAGGRVDGGGLLGARAELGLAWSRGPGLGAYGEYRVDQARGDLQGAGLSVLLFGRGEERSRQVIAVPTWHVALSGGGFVRTPEGAEPERGYAVGALLAARSLSVYSPMLGLRGEVRDTIGPSRSSGPEVVFLLEADPIGLVAFAVMALASYGR